MFFVLFLVLFVGVENRVLTEPKFQVLTPDELMVEVPHYDDAKLVTFRIGVRRKENKEEDLELGENDISNHRIFIYDQRLKLKKDDVVNYLIAFRDKDGYQAQTGNYVFDGVYCKKPSRHRFRRTLISSTTTKAEFNLDAPDPDAEEFPSLEPRFGHYPHRGRGHWPSRGPPHGFNPFGPHRPPFSPYPHPPPYGGGGPPPDFGDNCNDHRHDSCHERDTERFESSTVTDVEYHCTMCKKHRPHRSGSTTPDTPRVRSFTTTSRSTTTEDTPDIDIRFSD